MLDNLLDRLNRPRSPGDPDDTDLPISCTVFHKSTRKREKFASYQAKYFTAKVVTLTLQRIIYSQHSVSLLNFLKVS